MKPTKEAMDAYKMMAAQSPKTMKAQIEQHLAETCPKFIGNEDKIDRCIKYLTECAREILGGKNGDVADDVCFKICRDYFNDEVWKAEDEEEAKKKAEKAKRDAERKKSKSNVITATLDDARDDSEDEDDTYDVPAITPAKPKHCDGQLDMFAALGV